MDFDFTELASESVAFFKVERNGPLIRLEIMIDDSGDEVGVLCSVQDARRMAAAILASADAEPG